MKNELTTIPSHHIIKVNPDTQAGGYEVVADLSRLKNRWLADYRSTLREKIISMKSEKLLDGESNEGRNDWVTKSDVLKLLEEV